MTRIRKHAKGNDWILGTVGKGLSRADFRKVVYLAKVTEVLEPQGFKKYWKDQRFLRQIDRVYPSSAKNESVPWNPHTKELQAHDKSVDRVLISQRFYYFGENPKPVGKWRKFVSHRYQTFNDIEVDSFITFAEREWRGYKNTWAPPSQPRGLLIHVGNDLEPGTINEDGPEYKVELLNGHPDPDLQHLTFGDWLSKTHEFDRVHPGDYLFFNFRLYRQGNGCQWYVTAYYRIAAVKTARDLVEGGLAKKAPYRYNPHITRRDLLPGSKWHSNRRKFRLFVGDKTSSKAHLSRPVLIDRRFWKTLDLRDKKGVVFVHLKERKWPRYTPEQFNGSYLRTPKPLSALQTARLLKLTGDLERHHS